jgi:flagellar basal-body rod modification protein FlgD
MQATVNYKSKETSKAGAGYWTSQEPERKPVRELGKNDFLKLLVTELKNQDVLNNTDNKEFVARMAQFSSLEQMENLNRNTLAYMQAQFTTQAGGLIGRTVETSVRLDDDTFLRGKVDAVEFINGIPILVIGSERAPVASVSRITQ